MRMLASEEVSGPGSGRSKFARSGAFASPPTYTMNETDERVDWEAVAGVTPH